MIFKKKLCLVFLVMNSFFYAGPFTIVPKEGTSLPTEVIPGYDVQAYYTITNNTTIDFHDVYVSNLPKNVSQVTTDSFYTDTCGVTFDLAAGESKTLKLNISGLVDVNDKENFLFVSLAGGKTGAGTEHPLSVVERPWEVDLVNHEIVDIQAIDFDPTYFVLPYIARGSNPISPEDWENYRIPDGFIKNTSENVQISDSRFISSPGHPNGELVYLTTDDGYTWLAISNAIIAVWPYDSEQYDAPANQNPFYAGIYGALPEGVVKLTINCKAQQMRYFSNKDNLAPGTPGAIPLIRYFITDEWGGRYIMHLSGQEDAEAAFNAAVLPPGWTKSIGYLDKDLILSPAVGEGNLYQYNLVRDNQGNVYHQYYWNTDREAGGGNILSVQIEAEGMPLWGGPFDGPLVINNGFNNLIYGGGGKREFIFPVITSKNTPNIGINTVMGFNADRGDTLNFEGQAYTQVKTQLGVQLTLESGLVVILSQYFLWDDAWVVG